MNILLIAVLIIAGCSIIPFYTDKNNVMEYLPNIEEDYIYKYNQHEYSVVEVYDSILGEWVADTTDTNYEVTDTCRDVEVRGDKAFYLFNSMPGFVFIKDRGIAAITLDSSYVEDEDFIFLKTPVELDGDWLCDSMKVEIKSMGETYEKNELKVNDVIVIEIVYDIDALGNIYRLSYSPTLGIVKEYTVINDNGDVYAYTKELLSVTDSED